MAKMRIYDVAREMGVPPKELIEMLKSIGVTGKVPSSSIEDTAAQSLRQMVANKNNPQPVEEEAPAPAAPTTFENFRAQPRRTSENDAAVSSDVIEDFRESAAPVAAPAAAPPSTRGGAPTGKAPAARSTAPAGGASNGTATGAATGTAAGAARPAAPTPPPSVVAPQAANKFVGRGGGKYTNTRDRGGRARTNRFDRTDRTPRFGDRDFQPETEIKAKPKNAESKVLEVPPEISVADLAAKMNQPVAALIKRLFTIGVIRAGNQTINADVAGQIATAFGYTIEVETARPETHIVEEDQEGLVKVPAVVTIMGHVDHGKTSLLDIIRSANVQSGEAGGITQRIGAYETEHNGERIVFLDTPGHEAFTRMRARGAHVTDIAILVVAADDGVMPQTREAIDHARAAKVPIIVAMNKMDKAGADPERVKGQLAEAELIPEDYGGDVQVVPVSAKTGQGVQDLLDIVLLVAEIQELKANPHGEAVGTVIEAQQDTRRGPVATVLIHRGTLRVGDHVVVGDVFGRVRAMQDYKGANLKEAGPKTPVSVMGLSKVPHASDTFRAVESARIAREEATQFGQDSREGRDIGSGRASLDEIFRQIQQGAAKELNVIVKADVQGSVEALCQSLEKLAHAEARVKIVARGAGNVTESDVLLASATNAIIIAFSVPVDGSATSLAEREKIEIRSYDVIYAALDDVKAALEGMLEPIYEEKLAGEAEVKALFKSTRAGTIAGCMVTFGKVIKGSTLRAFRQGRKIYDGKIDSLKHVKSDVAEMAAGQECGIASKGFDAFQPGDVLQSIQMVPVKRDIETARPETAVVGAPEKR